MKIHWHPLPLPQPPPLRKPPTPLETELQTAELADAVQAQRSRLSKLYSTRKSHGDLDEETRPDEDDSGSSSKQNIDVIV